MLFLDMPNVPPQKASIVVAQKSQATQQNTDRTIGVCSPIENKPESRLSAINAVDPVTSAYGYLRDVEHKVISDSAFSAAKMTILQATVHGEFRLYEQTHSGRYFSSDYSYTGPDRASVLVEVGDYKVKVMYYFQLMQNVPGSSDEGTATDDKKICPNGETWKISFSNGSSYSTSLLTVQAGLTLHSRGTR